MPPGLKQRDGGRGDSGDALRYCGIKAMKTNKTLAYGLACLYYLGEHHTGQWNQLQKISEFQGLSTDYCAKVMRALVCAGFAESRGQSYRLKKALDDINVWGLMVSFISNFAGAPEVRKSRISLNLHRVLFDAANHWLVGLTVQDIIEMTKKERPRARKARNTVAPGRLPALRAAK